MLSTKYVIKSLAVKTNNVQTENCSAININTNSLQNLKKLGINKSIPNYTLDVNGTINFTGLLLRDGEPYSVGLGYWNKFGNNIHNANSGRVEINPGCTFVLLSKANMEISNNTFFLIKNSTANPYKVTSGEFATLRGSLTNTTIQNQINTNQASISTINTKITKISYNSSTLTTSIFNNFALPSYNAGVLKCSGPTGIIVSGQIVNNDITNGTIQNSKLANSTISGVPLGNNLFGLIFDLGLSLLSGTNNYNGSVTQIVSVKDIVPSMIKNGFYTGSNRFVLENGELGDAKARSITGSNNILGIQGASSGNSKINIGTTGVTIINIGNSSSTVNIPGTTNITNEQNLNVKNKTISLNVPTPPATVPGSEIGAGIIIDYNKNGTLAESSMLLNSSGSFQFTSPTNSGDLTNSIAVDTIVPTESNTSKIIYLGNPNSLDTIINFPTSLLNPPFQVNSSAMVTNLCANYLGNTTGTLSACLNQPGYSTFIIKDGSTTINQTATIVQDSFTFQAGNGINFISSSGSKTLTMSVVDSQIYSAGQNILIDNTNYPNVISTTPYLILGDLYNNIVIDNQLSTNIINNSLTTNNIILGQVSLTNLQSGSYNIGIGYNTGSTLESGQYNIFIGANTDVSDSSINNSVAIGNNAQIMESGEIVLGGEYSEGNYHLVNCPGDMNIYGNTSLENLTVSGTTILSSTLNVTGTTTLSTLNVTGVTTLTGALNANGGIYGTIQTANQPNITTIGQLSSLIVTGNITSQNNINAFGNISASGNISGTNLSGTLTTAAQPNIISVGTLSSLNVTNTVTAIGGFVSGSDYRIKSDIEDLDDKYSVDNLRPVKFKNTLASKQDIGLIAHELEEHYPFLVTGEKDGEEYQSVNYIGLIGILIHEIKNLKKEVKELKDFYHNI